MSYRVRCSEVWGGIEDTDRQIETSSLSACVYSRSAEGGKGGDIYFMSVCGADCLTRIAVGDVMGHGQAVSRVSNWVYESLKQHIENPAGQELVANLNNTVEHRGFEAMTTITLVSLIIRDAHLYFAYAGHPPMMVWRRREKQWAPARVSERNGCNLPLGVMANTCYDQSSIVLEPGDQFFIYTDGVLEAPDPSGRHFGESGLTRALGEAAGSRPPELKEAVLQAIHDHTGGRTDHDDVTLLAVEAFPSEYASAV